MRTHTPTMVTLVVGAVVIGGTAYLAGRTAPRIAEPVTTLNDPIPSPTPTPSAMLETADEAVTLARQQLPSGFEPSETAVRLARAHTINAAVPTTVGGWSADTPMWVVVMRTPGLTADDVVHVPAPVSDNTEVIGVAYVLDAPSGFWAAQLTITTEAELQRYLAIPDEQLAILPATIGPPPTHDPSAGTPLYP